MVFWSSDFVCLLLFPSFVKIQISRYFCWVQRYVLFFGSGNKGRGMLLLYEIDRCQGKLEAVADDGKLPPIRLGVSLVV